MFATAQDVLEIHRVSWNMLKHLQASKLNQPVQYVDVPTEGICVTLLIMHFCS